MYPSTVYTSIPGMDAKCASPGPSGSFLLEENARNRTSGHLVDMIEVPPLPTKNVGLPAMAVEHALVAHETTLRIMLGVVSEPAGITEDTGDCDPGRSGRPFFQHSARSSYMLPPQFQSNLDQSHFPSSKPII